MAREASYEGDALSILTQTGDYRPNLQNEQSGYVGRPLSLQQG